MAKFVGSLNVPTISTAPLSASEGDVYYNTTADDLLFYVNSSWTPVGTIQNISAGAGISVSGSGDSRQVSLEPFASSSSSGTPGTSFVKSLSSDVYGRVISYESGSVQNASTTAAGIVQLSDSISTTSSILAATPTAVKSAYDIADGKVSKSGDTITGKIVISSTADDAMTVSGAIKLATAGSDNAIYVGDDSIIFDADTADTMGIKGQQTAANGAIVFGSGKDTNLYRSAANTLKTDDSLIVAGDITGDGVTTDLVHGITLQRTTTLTVNTSTDASATAITWSSAVKNTSLYAYWSSGSTITIPLTGWYSITCHLASGGGLGTGFAFRLYVLVNGVLMAKNETQAQANTNNDTPAISTIQYLTAADALVFRASASSASKTIGGARNSACSVVYMGNMSA